MTPRRARSHRLVASPEGGARLRAAREQLGLTVRQLASRLRVAAATVSDAERGGDARLSTLRAYAREIPDLPVHALLGVGLPREAAVAGAWQHLAASFGFVIRRLVHEVTIGTDGRRLTRLRADGLRAIGPRPDWRGAAHLLLQGSATARAGLAAGLDAAVPGSALQVDIEDACFVHRYRAPAWPGPRLRYERVQREGSRVPEGMHEPGTLALSAPFRAGISLEVTLPVETLELAARVHGDAIAAATCAAWTDGQSLPLQDADLAPRLHEPLVSPRLSRSRREVRLVVKRPLIGLQYGIGWGEGVAPMSAPARRSEPAAPQTPARALRRAREAAALSQRALAALLGVSPVTVAQAERGQDLRLSLLAALARELPALDPRALLGAGAEAPTMTRREVWGVWRELLGIEADEERKMLVITANGDAHAVCETLRLRRVHPSTSELRIRYSSVQALGRRLPTVLKAIEDAVAEEADEGLRARVVARRQGRLIHEITVPRHLAQSGVSYTRRLFNARFFDPDADDAGPVRHDGAAIVPFHPVRRLRLTVTFPPGRFPGQVWFGVHPRMLLDGPLPEGSVAERLHPEGLGVVRDEAARTFTLSVEHPLVGFIYDAFWRRA